MPLTLFVLPTKIISLVKVKYHHCGISSQGKLCLFGNGKPLTASYKLWKVSSQEV